MLELQNKIKKYMSDYRYMHTLSVAKECERLADMFGADKEKLVTAAYLHDVTKEMTEEEQFALCEEYGIELDKDTLDSPKTMHSFSAPLLISKDFPEYKDDIVLEAVKYHTTGKADMNIYEKLLYLADYIEPTRKFDDCIKVRNYFYSSLENGVPYKEALDKTLLLSLKITIDGLKQENRKIHKETINAYDFLLKNTGDQNNG